MKLPTISIVTLSFNPDPGIWRRVLESIRMQDYPKGRIEHIVMDGGSTNGAVEIAKTYGASIYIFPSKMNNSEERKSLGIKKAKGEIVAFIETDNILPNRKWFRQMVRPFTENAHIIGTFSAYNAFDAGMPVLTRYCALFGVNDPVVYYLRKSEKLPYFKKTYDKGEMLAETHDYFTVRFNRFNLPTLGDNGHLVRRNVIEKANKNPKTFLHTDAFAQLTSLGFDTYGVVKNSVVHYIGVDVFRFLKRRLSYKNLFYDHNVHNREYLVYDPRSVKDRWNLFRFVIFSSTFLEPLAVSVRGWFTVSDPAWFLHPILCFLTLVSYTYSVVAGYFKDRL